MKGMFDLPLGVSREIVLHHNLELLLFTIPRDVISPNNAFQNYKSLIIKCIMSKYGCSNAEKRVVKSESVLTLDMWERFTSFK